ncbi:DUF763 domain-containing protein [Candidatus Bathyarchaeota archaeon]|nr:DUF763 domain-containing protein [Candidatus Bathyarchaeota archaeon]
MLHGGRAPEWLVSRMERLAQGILKVMIDEYGEGEVLKRLSDPLWFQALSCALAYDWDSSGTTTVVCGVLKTVLEKEDLGLKAAGGKGRHSNEVPEDLFRIAQRFDISEEDLSRLRYASRMAAKVDNAAIQAGYRLYHHTIFVSKDSEWCVVQQGMNPELRAARRYHWLSKNVKSFVEEPHEGIIGSIVHKNVLDMTARESEGCRKASTDLAKEPPSKLERLYQSLRLKSQESLKRWLSNNSSVFEGPEYIVEYRLNPKAMNWKALAKLYEFQPRNYEQVLAFEGIGPATVRGLALISELIFGEKASWRDPVKYSFAFGGKDGVPFPVRRKEYDEAIAILEESIHRARLGERDRFLALRRLRSYIQIH